MKRRRTVVHLEITEQTTADLRAKQSVRTTFKLPERSINALSALAGQLGIKQKSLFDHLIDDYQALQMIAEQSESFIAGHNRVAKTYVVSRRTLDNLDRISRAYNAPRDALVEYSIERILPLIEKEKIKHEKRKELATALGAYLKDGARLLNKAEEGLGAEDQALLELLPMIRSVQNTLAKVEDLVRRGEKLEAL